MQRNRLLLLAGAAGLAIVAVVVAILVAGSGGGSSDTIKTTITEGVGDTFQGVPQQNDYVGQPNAPATLVVYEDPQCPFCKQWNLDTLPTVMQNYVRTGKLRLRYRGIAIIGVNSVAGLRAIYAAGKQDKLWNMMEALYEQQGEENSGWITIPVIKDAATTAGANPDQVVADADSKSVTAQLNASQKEAADRGINATPTFILERPLAQPVQVNVSSLEPDGFTSSLDAALQ